MSARSSSARFRLLFGAALFGFATAASAQTKPNMSCADYLKAETGSDWSQGMTGKPGMDQESMDRAKKTHDFCAAHPDQNASQAPGAS